MAEESHQRTRSKGAPSEVEVASEHVDEVSSLRTRYTSHGDIPPVAIPSALPSPPASASDRAFGSEQGANSHPTLWGRISSMFKHDDTFHAVNVPAFHPPAPSETIKDPHPVIRPPVMEGDDPATGKPVHAPAADVEYPFGSYTDDRTYARPQGQNDSERNIERLRFMKSANETWQGGCCDSGAATRANAWKQNFTEGGTDVAHRRTWPPLPEAVLNQQLPASSGHQLVDHLDALSGHAFGTDKDGIPTAITGAVIDSPTARDQVTLSGPTIARVMQFQMSNKLPVTGIADPVTLARIAQQGGAILEREKATQRARDHAFHFAESLKTVPGYKPGVTVLQRQTAETDPDGVTRIKIEVKASDRDSEWDRKIPQSYNGMPVVKTYVER